MWETIDGRGACEKYWTARLKVPGGWIVRTTLYGYKTGAAISQTFVADPFYEWVLEKK